MLEPFHACNLSCAGCGRIREYADTMHQRLSVEQCLAAVGQCGAPIVSVCGGEPLIYPEIGELVESLVLRRKRVYLSPTACCWSRSSSGCGPAAGCLSTSISMAWRPHTTGWWDGRAFCGGLARDHGRQGRRFKVCTNSTVYRDTDMREIAVLFGYLEELGVDGLMISPAFGYAAVCEANPDGAERIFMTREEVHAKFREAEDLLRPFRLTATPIYLEFLRGQRELSCAAWPTRPITSAAGGGRATCSATPIMKATASCTADRLGQLRARRRPTLPALPSPLRLRARGRAPAGQGHARHPAHGRLADDVILRRSGILPLHVAGLRSARSRCRIPCNAARCRVYKMRQDAAHRPDRLLTWTHLRLVTFDPEVPVSDLSGNLPHWRQEAVTYFVTFRLGDSIPQAKLMLWTRERHDWLNRHPPPHDHRARREYYSQFVERFQRWLDAGSGSCVLAQPAVRQIVANAIAFFENTRYSLREWVVMPTHVHAVVTPLVGHELSDVLHSWKSYTAKQVNRLLGKEHGLWQKESFDHIVRGPDQLERIERYIHANPKTLSPDQYTLHCLHADPRS